MRSLIIPTSLLLLFPLTGLAFDQNNWAADIELNLGYNDNVYLESDESPITDGTIAQSEDTQNQFILGFYSTFFERDNSDAKFFIDYFFERFTDNEIETSTTSLVLPYSYYSNNYRVQLSPLTSRYAVSGKTALTNTGASFDLTFKFGDLKLGTGYQVITKNAHTQSYDAYQGDNADINIHLQSSRPGQRVKFTIGGYENNYQEVNNENGSYSGLYVSSSLLFISHHTELSLYGKIKTKSYQYETYNSALREDTNSYISVTPGYYVGKKTMLYLSLEWTKNQSNYSDPLSDMNYTQAITSVGFRYSI